MVAPQGPSTTTRAHTHPLAIAATDRGTRVYRDASTVACYADAAARPAGRAAEPATSSSDRLTHD